MEFDTRHIGGVPTKLTPLAKYMPLYVNLSANIC